ncbi:MAG: iron-containing alcohol dehydrogenase [Burkholderiaceae bacterium]
MTTSLPTGMHEYLAQDRVIWGHPAAEAVVEEATRRGARRVMIVSSRTLNRRTDAVERIRAALGDRHVATFDECVEHTPRETVIAAADAARACQPDLVVTVGGGTAIDTVKVMQIAVAHDLREPAQLSDFHLSVNPDGSRRTPTIRPAPFRQIVVSTTLGAAEFSDFGGSTDRERGVKDGYAGRLIGAAAVILDPAITRHTPRELWLSTGIRGVDHAVEGICSTQASPLIHATCMHALRLFARSLPRTMADPDDLQARLECQHAGWLAGLGILRVPYGASHGIGHSLGAVTGISHGVTSCIMLPHVMRFNLAQTRAQQADIAAALNDGRRTTGPEAAADLVTDLIEALQLPTRLSTLGVDPALYGKIAEGALNNLWVRTNPRPITDRATIENLLAAAS